MRHIAKAVFVAALVLLTPGVTHAQATLAGTLRDSSGAVLPGVTVEATSPVLIEKVRTAITDATGQYRITELLPGTYTLTFTLAGFTTVRREGVDLSGSGVTTINAQMRVGGVTETITVTGETPVVDIQSTRRQTVLDDEVVNTLPATRGYNALILMIPSVTVSGFFGAQTGGNTFRTRLFFSGAGDWSQGNNISDELRAINITEAGLIKNWDLSGALGGPILKDRLWFHLNLRSFGDYSVPAGGFTNRNAGTDSFVLDQDFDTAMVQELLRNGQPRRGARGFRPFRDDSAAGSPSTDQRSAAHVPGSQT